MEAGTAPQMPATSTRGILHPRRMARHVAFHRVAPPPELEGLVEWSWSVAWDLPEGATHAQDVLSSPGVNLSVGPAPPPGADPPPGPYPVTAKVNGVITRRSRRVLVGTGWTVAAKTTTGGFAAWYPGPVSRLTDRILTPDRVWPDLGEHGTADLVRAVESARAGLSGESAAEAAATVVTDLLVRRLHLADADRVATAREVAGVAALAERERGIRRVRDLATATGTSVRTLQRLFAEYVGISPKWLICRHRLVEAAERAHEGHPVDWAAVAAELGYADQAHLTRDFRAVLGDSPAAYTAAQAQD